MRADPVALACPKCGQPLEFVFKDGRWCFYECTTHRIVVVQTADAFEPPADEAERPPRSEP